MGMSDQEPAAIINNKVFAALRPTVCMRIITTYMREGARRWKLMNESYGDGKNQITQSAFHCFGEQ